MSSSEISQTFVLLYITVPDESVAKNITTELLNGRAAACTNLIKDMQSTYWWQGKIETATEFILLIKTTKELSPTCQKMILQHHPYTTPCILELPISEGNPAFLNWIRAETAPI